MNEELKTNYVAPQVRVVKAVIEKGFAASGDSEPNRDDFNARANDWHWG